MHSTRIKKLVFKVCKKRWQESFNSMCNFLVLSTGSERVKSNTKAFNSCNTKYTSNAEQPDGVPPNTSLYSFKYEPEIAYATTHCAHQQLYLLYACAYQCYAPLPPVQAMYGAKWRFD